MKRACKISSDVVQKREIYIRRRSSSQLQKPPDWHLYKILAPSSRIPANQAHLIREFTTQNPESSVYKWPNVANLFLEKWSRAEDSIAKKYLIDQVSALKDELLENSYDMENFERVLEEKGVPLFRSYPDGSAVVELLKQLASSPDLALQVFNWRREQLDPQASMTSEEYARGITVAGRLKDVPLANEFFQEAVRKKLKATSTYNALMSVYMYNGRGLECQSVVGDLKQDPECSPTIVTYNILISVFGRMALVRHMETALRGVKKFNMTPNVITYNNLIAGYITAWMWNSMEETYMIMNAEGVRPNLTTYLLMLRGYAHSRKLRKMEEMYEVVKDHVNSNEVGLLRVMISAYCRSSDPNRVEKIEEMLKLIPENEYRPWLNVLLIRTYANEDLLERMEYLIAEALEHNTAVTTAPMMRIIGASYFRSGAVDKLAAFVTHAESAGWKICRSLYHCKMVMYSSERRLAEMERVIDDMDRVNLFLSQKTFCILWKAYSKWGQKNKLQKVLGMMCKRGYTIPLDACCS